MIRTGLFRYVPHRFLGLYLKRGWMVIADLGPVHGHWSALCWHCECGEVRP